MTLLLEKNMICPYSSRCPHNSSYTCQGGLSNRNTEFRCSYVNNEGKFNNESSIQRNPLDKTGNMTVIME